MTNRGLKRSFGDFKRHPWLHFISITTITASLILLGVFFLVSRNLQDWADKSKSHSVGTVFLKEGVTEAQVDSLKNRLMAQPQVKTVVFKTKQSLMEELQGFLGNESDPGLATAEIFPDVLEVEMQKDLSGGQMEELRGTIMTFPEVAETDFSDDWMTQFKKVRHFFHWFGIFLSIGMVVGCGFIVANFMGLRHQSRRNEIEIIRLHGANRFFILAPFLWEGFIEGILGSALSLLLLYSIKILIGAMMSVQWSNLLGAKELLFLSAPQTALVILLGIGMAFFGSFTVFMRFQDDK